MLSVGWIIAAALMWLGLLFAVALYGERHAQVLHKRWAVVYGLSLAIHCTSWTFYGTVTQASRSGWWLPPTFVGAILIYLFAADWLRRLVRMAHEYNAGSLADLIAARLGRHSGLAALVTAVMLVGMVPYVALQLKAVAMSYAVLSRGHVVGTPAWQDSALYVGLVMAVFTMLFGTRRAATTEHNRGLMLAVAFESLFKLAAMLALGVLLFVPIPAGAVVGSMPPTGDASGFPALILLGALAMFTMPHQFHAGVVECRDDVHVRTARWVFPLYLLLISLPILPLARLGDRWLGPVGVASDLYVLALPLAHGDRGLALVAFLGGLSAATSMVVIATLTLSLMVSNHFVAPLLVRAGWGRGQQGDLRGAVLMQRRIAILAIVLLAWAYSRVLARSDALADIGAISFSALAGLAPATLIAMYRPHVGARAVWAGLLVGVLVWFYALLPALFVPQPEWVRSGPLGVTWLAPAHLLGLDEWGRLTRAVVLSLAANVATTWLVARSRFAHPAPSAEGDVGLSELHRLAGRFLPAAHIRKLFAGAPQEGLAEATRVAAVEHELAAVIGASSARLLLDVMRHQGPHDLAAVAEIVGEAAQDLRFNQRVLAAALASMSQGICVIDAQLRVVAWNRPYERLFDYPPGLLVIGRPVADLVRYNLGAGLAGGGEIDSDVRRRLAHMHAGSPHHSERTFPHGRVIEIRGNAMPGGGYVATYTDVTASREVERALKRANETLEERVADRTQALERATAAAQHANDAKSHFLAAVSHDLLQPLHAAQLFAHTLRPQLTADTTGGATLRHLDGALEATENLLAGLLDIARLEGGRIAVERRAFALAEVLDPLAAECQALARERGMRLRVVAARGWAHSDPALLRRIVQNFLSNALRYTERGEILLGCRRRGADWRIEVWDTGPGIAPAEQQLIFEEFRRGSTASGQGLGLGLAIAKRIAGLLGHRLSVRSWPGRGSLFAVRVPRVAAGKPVEPSASISTRPLPRGRALVLDNDPDALAALATLLEQWGWTVHAARSVAHARQVPWVPDLLLLDYHLDGGHTGLDALQQLRPQCGAAPVVVITADRDPALRARLLAAGVQVLYKPMRPLALRQLILRHVRPGSDVGS
ncbi:MAG: response regulator [Rhodanobacter sp.]|nr:MAG: response regulator [Rhodanobacter sp.]TAM13241.1 MAG: response regulator [Rhodanobacter sp.]TAM35339.1 MAG: response regulator [Rhodanobacter sp.]